MDVAKCPSCGHDLSLEDITSKHVRLAVAAGGVIASVAVQDMVLQLPEYQPAQNGFDERVAEITERLHETSDSLAEWGDAYDG